MKIHRTAMALLGVLALVACKAGLLGLAVGDIRGLWIASTYEVRDRATGDHVLQLLAAGGQFTMSIDDQPEAQPRVSAVFADGAGGGWSGGGEVDVRAGTLTIEGILYQIDHHGNDMTLTTRSAMYDFGSGPESAFVTIRLRRI